MCCLNAIYCIELIRKGEDKNSMLRSASIGVILTVALLSPLLLSLNVEAATDWCEIGVPYLAVDGLTVTLHSFVIVETTGSYQYYIDYTLENKSPSAKILEGAFKLYYRDAAGGLPQYGFFNYLFPGGSITRSYMFEELKSIPCDVLEYHHDNFFSGEPLIDSLKWKVVYPDDTPPVTEHDYDGLWHNADFIVTLTVTDNINGIAETCYRINNGPVENVSANGQPHITTEIANNTLEYWSIDNADNEELPHKILTEIKLDKTTSTIGTPNQSPSSAVDQWQEVKVSVNITDAFSGVKNANLLYTLTDDKSWQPPRPLSYNATTGYYETTIPGQPDGTIVKYKIVAYDNAGNMETNDNAGEYYIYSVIPELLVSLALPLFMIVTLLAVIVHRRNPKSCRASHQNFTPTDVSWYKMEEITANNV